MINFIKKFWIRNKEDNESYAFTLDDHEDAYESPLKLKVNKQLQKDDVNTWDNNDIESQYIDGQIVNYEMNMPNPSDIKNCISFYRSMSENFYIDDAVTTITNEAIIEEQQKIVSLDLTHVDMPDKVKEKIHEEFNDVLRIIKFRKNASNWFSNFYIDGRSYYRMIFDTDNIKKGVIGLQELDAKFVEKFYIKRLNKIMYQYTDIENKQVAITENAMIAINSGKINADRTMYVSYLDRAIKSYNLLTLLVDAMAIYRITRAPERRVFNISTGRMAPMKAKKYVKAVIAALKSNITYNSQTGKISQKARSISMIEDYYFPKGQDEKGTEVNTLSGGQQLGEISDIQFLERNLLKALMIPISRADTDSTMNTVFGSNTSDIEKEENKFAKFINSLRYKFREIFLKPLRINLILKKIITPEEWDNIEQDLELIWVSDSHISEMKFLEKLERRIEVAESLENYIGKVYSQSWINKNVLRLTDEEYEEQQKQIKLEQKNNKEIVNDTDDDE